MTVEEAVRKLQSHYGDSYENFTEVAREVCEAVRGEAYADGLSEGEHPDDI